MVRVCIDTRDKGRTKAPINFTSRWYKRYAYVHPLLLSPFSEAAKYNESYLSMYFLDIPLASGYTPAGIPCIPDTAQSTVIKRKGAIIPDVGDMTEIRQATPSGIDSRLREPDPRPSRKAMRG